MSKLTSEEFIGAYDKHVREVYRFLFTKTGSREIAQDLTSETFLRTWEYGRGKDIGHLRGFLFRTARNLTVDYYRRKARKNEIALDSDLSVRLASVDIQSNIAEFVNMDSDMAQVRKYLENLRSEYADVIILHYIQELPIADVAQAMGKSEGAVRVTLHRALEALKQFYE